MNTNKVATSNNWSIVIDTDDLTGLASIVQGNKVVDSSEDAFALLAHCPDAVAQDLRNQLVASIIQEAGGVDAFQEAATNNRILFGSDFYDYMDESTLQAFADQGVFLSYNS